MNGKILVSGLLAIAIAGCADKGPGAQAAPAITADATQQAVAAAPAQPCIDNPFYSPLPDASLRFDFPFRIARDRVYEDGAGTSRRGLSLEYLEGTPETVWNAVSAAMEAAGYKKSAPSADAPYSGTFTKQGQTGIFVKVPAEPVKNPTGDDVKGSVWLSWSVETAPSAP